MLSHKNTLVKEYAAEKRRDLILHNTILSLQHRNLCYRLFRDLDLFVAVHFLLYEQIFT